MTDPSLDAALPGRHRRIDPDNHDDIYVVGDIHGCRETFEALLEELSLGPADLLVTVGDLVRKGPDSGGVLDAVRAQENVISVRGNNEQHLVSGRKSHPDHGAEDIAFMKSLPLAVSWDDVLVVHGGVNHRKSLTAHSSTDILNMRSLGDGGYERPYWFETRTHHPRVFFGHTVLSEPFASPYAVGLDTGCVYGGQLTAYDYRRDRFISVEPPATYQDRDESSIVTPQWAGQNR
ncbi:MAG: serine/threonine protein phosphatase 1 [Natronomonas sp.]|jgi:serine/threonine protein phosphatase 1